LGKVLSAARRHAAGHPFLILFALCVSAAFIFDFSANTYTTLFWVVFAASFAVLIVLALFWKKTGRLTENKVFFLLTAASFLLKLGYVLYTGLSVRQHDTGSFKESSKSHAGYIYNLYSSYRLPDSARGQYYHPPLHYILEAAWLRAQTFLGVAFDAAKSNVTALTLFYSCSAGVISYKIFKELGIKGSSLAASYSLVAFHPTFIILAASYNNDILSITFLLAALLFLFRWWKSPTYYNIICLALCAGLGTAAKLSASYVLAAVAAIFMLRFFTEKRKARVIGQFAAFGVVAAPLGLFWSVWLKVKYGLKFGYVMKLAEDSKQFVGFRTAGERLFDVFAGVSQGIYFARGSDFGNAFHEYNLLSAILKTSVFGEWHIGEGFRLTESLALILFILNAVLILFSVFCMVYIFIKRKKGPSRILTDALIVLYFTIMAAYIGFCFSFPHDCTMDFRYITPTLIIGAAFIGLFLNGESASKRASYFKKISFYVIIAFCACAFGLFLLSNYAAN